MSPRKGLLVFILRVHTWWLAERSCKCGNQIVDVNYAVTCDVGIVW